MSSVQSQPRDVAPEAHTKDATICDVLTDNVFRLLIERWGLRLGVISKIHKSMSFREVLQSDGFLFRHTIRIGS